MLLAAERLLTRQKRLSSKEEAVTIAAGMICRDGIIIAADTEVTRSFVKEQRAKLFAFQCGDNLNIMGAGAGDSLLIDNVQEKIRESLDVEVPDIVSVKSGIEKILVQTLKDIWPLYTEDTKPAIELLLAVRAADGLALFEIEGPKIRRVQNFAFIGYGTDLAIYKAKYLLLPHLIFPLAAPLLIHLLKVVKDNARYCGGDTTVWALKEDGKLGEMDIAEIKEIEKCYEMWELMSAGLNHLLQSEFVQDTELMKNFFTWAATEPMPSREEFEKDLLLMTMVRVKAAVEKKSIVQVYEELEQKEAKALEDKEAAGGKDKATTSS